LFFNRRTKFAEAASFATQIANQMRDGLPHRRFAATVFERDEEERAFEIRESAQFP
jgi:hypothetical protein